MTEVRLEDIQQALSGWARNEAALRDRVRLLDAKVQEQALLYKHGVEQVQEGFDLPVHPGATLQLVVEEALLAVANNGAEQVRTIATQKDTIEQLQAKVAGLELEAQESVDRMVAALELPPNRHRTLRNATTETTDMVVEAKKMIRENL